MASRACPQAPPVAAGMAPRPAPEFSRSGVDDAPPGLRGLPGLVRGGPSSDTDESTTRGHFHRRNGCSARPARRLNCGMTPLHRLMQPLDHRESNGTRLPGSTTGGRAGRVLVLEREVEQLNERIATLEREKAQVEAFAAVAAHELVEPLVMTEAYTSIISDRLGGPEHDGSRADLADARAARWPASGCWSRACCTRRSRPRIRSTATPVRVNAARRRTASRCSSPRSTARESQITVSELPDVSADEALLGGVFANLLINALKYSPRHGAQIRVGGGRRGRPAPVLGRQRGSDHPRRTTASGSSPASSAAGTSGARSGTGLGLEHLPADRHPPRRRDRRHAERRRAATASTSRCPADAGPLSGAGAARRPGRSRRRAS